MDQQTLITELSRLAGLAALAPSSHNCQPWRLHGVARAGFEADLLPSAPRDAGWRHVLLVGIDRRHALSALPSLEREMLMSIGGFASLLLNLLRLSGFHVQSRFIERGWQPATARGRARLRGSEPVLALFLCEPPAGAQPLAHPLAQWISYRYTVRGPYLPSGAQAPGGTCLPHRLADDAGLAWKQVLHGTLFDQLCEFYRRHAAEDFRHGAAWRETYKHLDFSEAPRHGGTSINIQSLFGTLRPWRRRMFQLLLHPAAMPLTGPLGLHRRIGRDVESLIRSSDGIVYLCAEGDPTDDRRTHLLAGEQVIELWLAATRDGQALHPLSVALQHPWIEAELRKLLGCKPAVIFIARFGIPAAPANPSLRCRRRAEAFCSFDFAPLPARSFPC